MNKTAFFIPIIVLLVFINSTNANAAETYRVEIDYDGEWSGNIGSFNSRTVSGSGSEDFDVTGDIIVAVIQKMDDSNKRLRVRIVIGGEILASEYTDAPYGGVTVTYSASIDEDPEVVIQNNPVCLAITFTFGAIFSATLILTILYLIKKKNQRRAIVFDEK